MLSDHIQLFGVSDTEFLLLWACHQSPNLAVVQNELALLVGVSPAQLSGIVDRLRGRGLMSSTRSVEDRRRQCWQLTAEGQLLLDQLLNRFSAVAAAIDQKFSIDQQQAVEQLLQRLTRTLHDTPTLRLRDFRDESRGSVQQGKRAAAQ
jgi:DNA-binding MarR family transcriptional regulator